MHRVELKDEYNPKIIICRLKFLMHRVELKDNFLA